MKNKLNNTIFSIRKKSKLRIEVIDHYKNEHKFYSIFGWNLGWVIIFIAGMFFGWIIFSN